MLVNVTNQRSVSSLGTHKLADASLLQSIMLWWVEQFWCLTGALETSAMRFCKLGKTEILIIC